MVYKFDPTGCGEYVEVTTKFPHIPRVVINNTCDCKDKVTVEYPRGCYIVENGNDTFGITTKTLVWDDNNKLFKVNEEYLGKFENTQAGLKGVIDTLALTGKLLLTMYGDDANPDNLIIILLPDATLNFNMGDKPNPNLQENHSPDILNWFEENLLEGDVTLIYHPKIFQLSQCALETYQQSYYLQPVNAEREGDVYSIISNSDVAIKLEFSSASSQPSQPEDPNTSTPVPPKPKEVTADVTVEVDGEFAKATFVTRGGEKIVSGFVLDLFGNEYSLDIDMDGNVTATMGTLASYGDDLQKVPTFVQAQLEDGRTTSVALSVIPGY